MDQGEKNTAQHRIFSLFQHTIARFFHEKRCALCGEPFVSFAKKERKTASQANKHQGKYRQCVLDTFHPKVSNHQTTAGGIQDLYEAAHAIGFFCATCVAMLPARTAGYCPQCGELAIWPTLPTARCGKCLQTPPLWESFSFYGVYEGVLRNLIIQHKFSGSVLHGYIAGLLLGQRLQCVDFDVIVPVPLHTKRIFRRGYNQALEIAKGAVQSRNLHQPIQSSLLVRQKNNPPQTGLSRAERLRNIQKIFQASPQVQGKTILLIDDVYTTGTTMRECTKVLLQAGAKTVHVAVVARPYYQRLA